MERPTLSFRSLVLTGLVLCLLALLGSYVLWQARFLLTGPQLQLTAEPASLQNERVVSLAGIARNISRITLNGKQIFTDPDGHFKEALVLENGYTIATIAATDRYGRETKLTYPLVYVPASLASDY